MVGNVRRSRRGRLLSAGSRSDQHCGLFVLRDVKMRSDQVGGRSLMRGARRLPRLHFCSLTPPNGTEISCVLYVLYLYSVKMSRVFSSAPLCSCCRPSLSRSDMAGREGFAVLLSYLCFRLFFSSSPGQKDAELMYCRPSPRQARRRATILIYCLITRSNISCLLCLDGDGSTHGDCEVWIANTRRCGMVSRIRL